MTASQIVLYAIIALALLFYLRRYLQRRRMKEYSAAEVANLVTSNEVVLLDVRTQQERRQYCIQGSLHIPIDELPKKIAALEKYRDKEIICYCHSGSRSFIAVSILANNGFKAANMQGGMVEWNYLNL